MSECCHHGCTFRWDYYIRTGVAVFGGALVCLMVVLYGVALNNTVPPYIAVPMDKLANDAESHK